MKKIVRSIAMTLFLSTALLVSSTASGAEPGTASDPIVTKSYVDQRIAELTQQLQNQQAPTVTTPPAGSITVEGDYDLDQLALLVDFLLTEKLSESAVSTNLFTPVLAPAGSYLYPTQDGLEVILRSGRASVVCGVNGITDLTTGTDLINGENIPGNHSLIIPRTDRGIFVAADTWFLLKGPYIITSTNINNSGQ